MLIAVRVPGPLEVNTSRRWESTDTPSLLDPVGKLATLRPSAASTTTSRLLAHPLNNRLEGRSYARPCGALQFCSGQVASTVPAVILTLTIYAVSVIFIKALPAPSTAQNSGLPGSV